MLNELDAYVYGKCIEHFIYKDDNRTVECYVSKFLYIENAFITLFNTNANIFY
jgi:hypothetical protein